MRGKPSIIKIVKISGCQEKSVLHCAPYDNIEVNQAHAYITGSAYIHESPCDWVGPHPLREALGNQVVVEIDQSRGKDRHGQEGTDTTNHEELPWLGQRHSENSGD